jgi:hypothetical protein
MSWLDVAVTGFVRMCLHGVPDNRLLRLHLLRQIINKLLHRNWNVKFQKQLRAWYVSTPWPLTSRFWFHQRGLTIGLHVAVSRHSRIILQPPAGSSSFIIPEAVNFSYLIYNQFRVTFYFTYPKSNFAIGITVLISAMNIYVTTFCQKGNSLSCRPAYLRARRKVILECTCSW